MSKCKECILEQVCRYNDGTNLYCKEDCVCPHYKTANAVEVIHCKDCKFYIETFNKYTCDNPHGMRPKNGCCFCSYGERRDT